MRELQQWMYETIVAPEEPEADEVLERLTEADRIGIYRGMYGLRMIEALESDYPAVAALLGQHNFGHLVEAYTENHPSQSYTFNRFGDRFPEFLATGAHHAEPRAFLAELARLELAMTEVFDEMETPLLDPEAIGSITPDTRLSLIAAVRLLETAYPVNELFQAYRDDEPLVVPAAERSWLVVYRRDYGVMRMKLGERDFAFLSAIASGATLGEACERIGPEQQELFDWFRDWSAAGLFGELA